MSDRFRRAMTENIFLVKFEFNENSLFFHILGSSKVVYKITFSVHDSPQCTCPDYKLRKRTCKHIYFVSGKVLHINRSEWINVADINIVANDILSRFSHLASEHVIANNEIMKKYENKLKRYTAQQCHGDEDSTKINIRNTECCVCLSEFIDLDDPNQKQKIIICYTCQNGIHKLCWNKWEQVNKKGLCVYCRNKIMNDSVQAVDNVTN
jgi:hypothetical protein